MLSCSRLPPALLELVLAKTSTPAILSFRRPPVLLSSSAILGTRRSHSAALKVSAQHGAHDQSFYARRQAGQSQEIVEAHLLSPRGMLSEFEERVLALKDTAILEESPIDATGYSEHELLSFYEDLLNLPASEVESSDIQPTIEDRREEDIAILRGVIDRLLQPEDAAPANDSEASFAQQLRSRHGLDATSLAWRPPNDHNMDFGVSQGTVPHLLLISRLESIISTLQTVQSAVSQRQAEDGVQTIPTGIMTEQEWSALIRYCVREQDGDAAENVLDLAKRSDTVLSEEVTNTVMAMYAGSADVQHIEKFVRRHLSQSPTEDQRDLHIKTYLKATETTTFPTQALSLLHEYEGRGIAAPQRTYTRLITHLFSARSSVAHAHAWDLFSHMRYVAHPIPDQFLYTTMIRACALPSFFSSAEPERALDLFTEMTVDQRLEPTAGAYTATILACARSGRKAFVHEAFRLAKEMLDSHRDAYGRSAFRPDTRLFCALLEGAKRIGDLSRVRWILAEIVKGSPGNDYAGLRADAEVNEEVMVHVFHAYAAYRPPFRRWQTVVVGNDNSGSGAAPEGHSPKIPETSETTVEKNAPEVAPLEVDSSKTSRTSETTAGADAPEASGPISQSDGPRFTHLPPQSPAEVVGEAKALWTRIVEDSEDPLDAEKRFRHVEITPRLLNSYLSVHYAHSSLEIGRDLYSSLFYDLGVMRNAMSYVEMLERCARCRKTERHTALELAQEVWAEWEGVELAWRLKSASENEAVLTTNARMVERARAAMVRMLSITGHLDEALEVVKSFVQCYPPVVVREPSGPKPIFRSTRTVLTAPRPLVRSTSTVDIPDDSVPPLLTFPDVEILHLKMVAAENKKGIKYLKWVCKSYEGALRMRRDRTMRATPVGAKSDERQDEGTDTGAVQG